MAQRTKAWTDHQVEIFIGNLLRIGVITSALLVFLGGLVYLLRHGFALPDFKSFRGEPEELCHVGGIIKYAFSLHPRGLIQLGLLLLIATPVARVVFSIFAFLRQRDKMYVIVTSIVLLILCYSLFGSR
ncbi:MAG: DUF1634 domain-containing protein [Candidatus Omnitrophica bacterium]|nr:DUF1634 domain-containing protein [Candidatus Omnitrophota bacterium]MDD5652919.1 DUF1634 domain-containing protein [Candidatus Omnitrophota bacterium]